MCVDTYWQLSFSFFFCCRQHRHCIRVLKWIVFYDASSMLPWFIMCYSNVCICSCFSAKTGAHEPMLWDGKFITFVRPFIFHFVHSLSVSLSAFHLRNLTSFLNDFYLVFLECLIVLMLPFSSIYSFPSFILLFWRKCVVLFRLSDSTYFIERNNRKKNLLNWTCITAIHVVSILMKINLKDKTCISPQRKRKRTMNTIKLCKIVRQ